MINYKTLSIKSAKKLGKNVKISDPEIAKHMLIANPNTWYLLDEKLQKDEELILYYQPLGYVNAVQCIDVGAIDERYLPTITPDGFEEAGFTIIPSFIKGNEELIEKYSKVQKQLKKYNDEFNRHEEKSYKELTTGSSKTLEDEINKSLTLKIDSYRDFDDSNNFYKQCGIDDINYELEKVADSVEEYYWFDITCYRFDRSDLDSIVKEVQKKAKQPQL